MHFIQVILFLFSWEGGRLFEVGSLKSTFGGLGGGGWCLFEAGRSLTFSTIRVGTYLRWALIQGWALK